MCSLNRRPETILKTKKVAFPEMINSHIIQKFSKDFSNRRKQTNGVVGFRCRSLPNILKYRGSRCGLTTLRKTRFLLTHIEKFSYYIWMFGLTVLFNLYWHTIRTWCFWWIKIGYDLLNQIGSYRKIMQFQINSRRKSRLRDA